MRLIILTMMAWHFVRRFKYNQIAVKILLVTITYVSTSLEIMQ